MTLLRTAAVLLGALICVTSAQAAGSDGETRFTGDLGGGVYLRSEMVRGTGPSTLVLPYVYGDYDRFYARIDTLGVRTVAFGHGHLELALRISLEGFDADTAETRGLSDRSHPLPIGIGTFQRTPIGGIFLYAFHDPRSGGALLEATWGGRFDLGRIAFYPLLGLEYRSRDYVQHLYGVSAAESAASGLPAYSPGASTVPMAGLAATLPITGPWALQFQWRHRWLGDAIGDSPIVRSRSQDSGHFALTYEFK